MLEISWITDIHNPPSEMMDEDDRPECQRGLKTKTLNALEQFVTQARQRKPALVISGGDNIDASADPHQDGVLQNQVYEYFAGFDEYAALWGNHDSRNGKALDLARNFNFISAGRKMTFAEATVLLWHADAAPQTPAGAGSMEKFYVAEKKAIDWLEDALASTDAAKPVLIFTHIPLDADGYTNPADENEKLHPNRFYYRNGQNIRNILKSSRRNIWIFSGHRHINRNFRNERLRLFTMDRLWRPFTKMGERLQGFNYARILVNRNMLTYTRFGAKPDTCECRI